MPDCPAPTEPGTEIPGDNETRELYLSLISGISDFINILSESEPEIIRSKAQTIVSASPLIFPDDQGKSISDYINKFIEMLRVAKELTVFQGDSKSLTECEFLISELKDFLSQFDDDLTQNLN